MTSKPVHSSSLSSLPISRFLFVCDDDDVDVDVDVGHHENSVVDIDIDDLMMDVRIVLCQQPASVKFSYCYH